MYDFKIYDEPFACGYINSGSDSIYISTGAGYIEAAKAAKIKFDGETGFPSFDFGMMACTTTFDCGQTPALWLLDKKANDYPEFANDYRFIAEKMKPLDMGAHMWSEFSRNEIDIILSHSGWGGTWGGHAVPDLIDFARFGTDGIREKILLNMKNTDGAQDFYQGLLLTLDAIDILGEKIYLSAKEGYEASGNPKLLRTMEAFRSCPRRSARTFTEAALVYVMIFTLDGIDSPGHFDLFMIDYWRNTPYNEARELLEDMWIFFHQTRTWNLCISGSDENWNDLTNELTYEILDVARKYKYQTPNLTMRCHRNTPEKLLRDATDTIALGMGLPVLYNDEVVCPALEKMGIPPSDSHRYVMNGCNQIDIQGRSHMGLEDGEVNLALALSYAIFGGYNIMENKQIGANTPPAEELDTYEKFTEALKTQIMHITDAVCSMANKCQLIRGKYSANPIRSMTIAGCIEKGLDYKNRGPLYGHGQILCEGIADCADSVANIKKYVYEEKRYSLAQVRDALLSDYDGQKKMLLTFKNSGLNFGNDNDYADSIAVEIVNFYNSYLLTKPTERGGFYSGGCSPFDRAAANGAAAGPLPNGKRRGEHIFADSIGATPGKDTKGPTALLSSCLKYDHTLPASGFILNLKFEKRMFDTEEGKKNFFALAKSYFDKGGQQLSVSVVNREDLVDALEHPEDHRDLIVRVGGFSAYFVDLTRELQENIIQRTSY